MTEESLRHSIIRVFTQIKRQLFQKSNLVYNSPALPWVIIGLGVVLRLVQYLFNRSLWFDESLLALNIIDRSFWGLLQLLDHNQGAPIGFLLLEKLVIQVFGQSEYALRLFPFLSGIASLFIFYEVAKHYVKTKAVLIALSLFAISGPLIYYSVDVKQYSSDVAIALLIYWATIHLRAKGSSIPRIVLLGILGALAIWFSHPAVFVLGGLLVSLTLFSLKRKEWTTIGRMTIAYLFWALSLVAVYFISLHSLSQHQALLNYWSGSFMPFPPLSLSEVKWFVTAFFRIFQYPGGYRELPGIAALAFLIGCISMFSRRKERFLILMLPAFLVLLASGFHKYPFSGRLLLFLTPSLLLLIAEGAEKIRDRTKHNWPIIGIALVGLLFFHPVLSAGYHLIRPRTMEEIKPVMSYVRTHYQDGDVLYLYCYAQYAFKYYSEGYGFERSDYMVGESKSVQGDWGNYKSELDELRGNSRVWILFSHVESCNWEGKGVDDEKLFLHYLDSQGKRLDFFKRTGATVYLYDLR